MKMGRAQLRYVWNACVKFQMDWLGTVGGVEYTNMALRYTEKCEQLAKFKM